MPDKTPMTSSAPSAATPLQIPLTGVDHVVFRVADVEATITWWQDHFGLPAERVDEWRAGDAPFPWIRVSASLIIDLFAGEPDGTNVDHVAFETDVVSFNAFAAAHHEELEMAPTALSGARGQGTGLYIKDPTGNRIEVRTYG